MIFPQTSHFDDLQKQKGKRLPCGVFPLDAPLFCAPTPAFCPADLQEKYKTPAILQDYPAKSQFTMLFGENVDRAKTPTESE